MAVRGFVGLHLPHDGARRSVFGRQALQVPLEMRLDLAFRFRHEAETGAIAEAARHVADREGAGKPERIEQARTTAECVESLACPRKVVFLVSRGPPELFGKRRVRRAERLSL